MSYTEPSYHGFVGLEVQKIADAMLGEPLPFPSVQDKELGATLDHLLEEYRESGRDAYGREISEIETLLKQHVSKKICELDLQVITTAWGGLFESGGMKIDEPYLIIGDPSPVPLDESYLKYVNEWAPVMELFLLGQEFSGTGREGSGGFRIYEPKWGGY